MLGVTGAAGDGGGVGAADWETSDAGGTAVSAGVIEVEGGTGGQGGERCCCCCEDGGTGSCGCLENESLWGKG